MNDRLETLLRDVSALAPVDQELVRGYVDFLRWRSGPGAVAATPTAAQAWHFNVLEHFAGSDVRAIPARSGSGASRDLSGMEVKTAEATVGGERRPALWQHPPVNGEAVVEFHVPVPTGLRDLRLRFAIGIRDGAQAQDRLMAFRVRLDGWQVWSRAAWPVTWQQTEVALPFQTGNVLRLAFVTDGLGDHQWAWAVWGEPVLVGQGV
jgi:hypothetical protein